MTIRIYEGFDQLANATCNVQMADKGWASITANLTVSGALSGRFGGKAAISFLAGDLLRYDISAVATGVMGIALWIGATPTSFPWRLLEFTDGTTVQVGVGINSSRQVFVYRGTTSTVIATGTTVLATSSWNYIEFKSTIHNTAGTYDVKLNGSGSAEISGSSVNTRSSANNQLTGFQAVFGATAPYLGIDDFYALDTAGSAPGNDFLGEQRIQVLYPTAAGSSTGWTPISGSNWQNVDDGGMNSDTDYNSATTNVVDLFTTGDLTGTPTVNSVAITMDARKDDAGTRQARNKLKSGATTSNGTTRTLASTYTAYRDQYDSDPNTSAQWTYTNVNAVEIGYENI